MKRRMIRDGVALALCVLFVAGTVCDAALAQPAPGGRRAAGFERSGPAARGSFSNPRPADRAANRPKPRPKAQEERTERTEIRQGERTERTEIRQDGQTERNANRTQAAQNIAADRSVHHHHYYDDDDDWGGVAAGVAVGAVVGFVAGAAAASPPVTVTYVTVLPCTPTVVVSSSVSYYGCSGTWYHRNYIDGTVRYVVVSAPPGW
jgi:hypothetical protein